MERTLRYCFLLSTLISMPTKGELLSKVTFSDVMALTYQHPATRESYGASPHQVVDQWLPDDATQARAHIILVHGGCWQSEYDIRHAYPMASALANQGYLVSGVEYRRTGSTGGGWPTSLNDINASLLYLLVNKNERALPTILIGHSAGGHLALLAAIKNESLIDLTIGLAPITNIESYAEGGNACQRAAQSFMGGLPDDIPSRYAEANPVNYDPPKNLLIFSGSEDQIVPHLTTSDYFSKATIIKNAGHFDVIHPDSESWSELISALDIWLTSYEEATHD